MSVPELSELELEPEPEPEFEELPEGGLRPTSSCMRGNRRGVSSNSAHPPLNPISTTLVNIRVISSFLNYHQTKHPLTPICSRKNERWFGMMDVPLFLLFKSFFKPTDEYIYFVV